MASVFLDSADTFTISDNDTKVFGNDGEEQIIIGSGVTNVDLDANVERVDLAGNVADFTFQQQGTALAVFENGEEVTSLPLQARGSQVVFADASVDVTVDGSGMQLGGTLVPSGTAGSVTPSTSDGTVTSDAGTGSGDGTGGGDGTGISLPTGQGEVTETATDEAETFTLDLQAAAATGDNTQIILEGFSAQEDTLQFDFDNQFIPSVQVDSLDDLDDVAVNGAGDLANVSSNPITNQTTVTLGMDRSDVAIALTLAGITEPASVEAEVV